MKNFKTFEALLIYQFTAIGKYDIELEKRQHSEVLYVWDTESQAGQYFEFDNDGNLIDMY